MMRLNELKIGEDGVVKGFDKSVPGYRQKLLAMGLTPGTAFTITRYAPIGDPIEIRVRDFALSLRKDEANAILVEKRA
ncbi:FeoA family protein [Beggiatoa leptomitoformis]|uniref:Ferrous iron transport protein A n=1 Tax=Beggiatoa leptomitoformis TaxID=288004 RepID=A0A2N9YA04_9GAMM|nr:FeoA family protein [Beggiatoa leptomitoformis]ALG67280.1 ferrous iron transport protein A [Beggiatoa leptomitoformis]AUI67293.1 ferrous iron transport protein A [Beggiatoa leptomitoformis]